MGRRGCLCNQRGFYGRHNAGRDLEEAIENLKEAVELYLEEFPELREELGKIKFVGDFNVQIAKAIG